jgi:hypothetical protein
VSLIGVQVAGEASDGADLEGRFFAPGRRRHLPQSPGVAREEPSVGKKEADLVRKEPEVVRKEQQ